MKKIDETAKYMIDQLKKMKAPGPDDIMTTTASQMELAMRAQAERQYEAYRKQMMGSYPDLARPRPVELTYAKDEFEKIPTSNAGELVNALLCRARMEGNDVDRNSTVEIKIFPREVRVTINRPAAVQQAQDPMQVASGRYQREVRSRLDYIVQKMSYCGGDPVVSVTERNYDGHVVYEVSDRTGKNPTQRFEVSNEWGY